MYNVSTKISTTTNTTPQESKWYNPWTWQVFNKPNTTNGGKKSRHMKKIQRLSKNSKTRNRNLKRTRREKT
jgi:hypothetical protein